MFLYSIGIKIKVLEDTNQNEHSKNLMSAVTIYSIMNDM